jgi:hypothetical protein
MMALQFLGSDGFGQIGGDTERAAARHHPVGPPMSASIVRQSAQRFAEEVLVAEIDAVPPRRRRG